MPEFELEAFPRKAGGQENWLGETVSLIPASQHLHHPSFFKAKGWAWGGRIWFFCLVLLGEGFVANNGMVFFN